MIKLFVNNFERVSSTIAIKSEFSKIPSSPKLILNGDSTHSLNEVNSITEFMPIFAIGLVLVLVIQVTKYILDNKLKNKIIDKGVSEQIAKSILERGVTDKKEDTIKWTFLLLGLSGGLMITYFTTPLDIHSLAIIAFSIGISFLSYYFFLKHSKK